MRCPPHLRAMRTLHVVSLTVPPARDRTTASLVQLNAVDGMCISRVAADVADLQRTRRNRDSSSGDRVWEESNARDQGVMIRDISKGARLSFMELYCDRSPYRNSLSEEEPLYFDEAMWKRRFRPARRGGRAMSTAWGLLTQGRTAAGPVDHAGKSGLHLREERISQMERILASYRWL